MDVDANMEEGAYRCRYILYRCIDSLQGVFLRVGLPWKSGRCFGNSNLGATGHPGVIKHKNGHHPFPIGNASTNRGFSMVVLDYRRVFMYPEIHESQVPR